MMLSNSRIYGRSNSSIDDRVCSHEVSISPRGKEGGIKVRKFALSMQSSGDINFRGKGEKNRTYQESIRAARKMFFPTTGSVGMQAM